jgi:hypothetical protein
MKRLMKDLKLGAFHEKSPAVVGTWDGRQLDPYTLEGLFARGQAKRTLILPAGSFYSRNGP